MILYVLSTLKVLIFNNSTFRGIILTTNPNLELKCFLSFTINLILHMNKMFNVHIGIYYTGTCQWRWYAQFSNLEK